MRWQRPIFRILQRWSDQVDPYGHSLNELAPIVFPVVVLGEDSVDQERPRWVATPFSPGVLAEASTVMLEAGSFDCRVSRVLAVTTAATRIGLLTAPDAATLFLGALSTPQASTIVLNPPAALTIGNPFPPGGAGYRLGRGNALWGAGGGLSVAALQPIELLGDVVILPAGQRLQVAIQDTNVGLSAIFQFQELAR